MKKTVIAIIVVVLLVAVFAGAAHRWGYTRYGPLYYSAGPYQGYQYSYYPAYQDYLYAMSYYPYRQYGYPSYNYPYYSPYYSPSYTYPYYHPLSSRYRSTTYQAGLEPDVQEPRSLQGQLCGVVDGRQFGCASGMVCDYSQGDAGVGICTVSTEDRSNWYYVG